MSELEVIGVLEGTDKSSCVSWSWDYLRHYDRLLKPFRDKKINVIEIGCSAGASLRMWKRYFEYATLIGIDIDQTCTRLADERTVVKIGSQDDPGFLQEITARYPPAIVIDDGSHIAHHMIATFEMVFPTLAPGGVYIFEDLAFHFPDARQYLGAEAHQGLSPTTIYDYLSRFVRARAADISDPQDSWGFQRYAFANIDEIIVFGGAIALRKREQIDVGAHVSLFEKHLAGDPSPDEINRYARFALRHGAPLPPVLATLEGVIASHPEHADNLVLRAEILAALGRPADPVS